VLVSTILGVAPGGSVRLLHGPARLRKLRSALPERQASGPRQHRRRLLRRPL